MGMLVPWEPEPEPESAPSIPMEGFPTSGIPNRTDSPAARLRALWVCACGTPIRSTGVELTGMNGQLICECPGCAEECHINWQWGYKTMPAAGEVVPVMADSEQKKLT